MLHKLKNDNKGASLVLVIICMAVIGILAAAILSMSSLNLRMKKVNQKARDNFYTAEEVYDELCTGIEEVANKALSQAYTKMLLEYQGVPASEKTKRLKRDFVNELYWALIDDRTYMLDEFPVDAANKEKLTRYFVYATECPPGSTTGYKLELANTKICRNVPMATDKVVIKNVNITYTDASGYQTKICTDLLIGCNSPALSTLHTLGEGLYYTDYAVICDGLLSTNASTNTQTVSGNIYAGQGIYSSSSARLKLKSDIVISRGDITVSSGAHIEINNEDIGNPSQIWVENIETKDGTSAESEYLSITGACYVKDDLSMNAKNGHVSIDGEYYGYSTPTNKLESKNSSSIVVNVPNSNLTFSDATSVWIGGKAYLNVPEIYGSDAVVTNSTSFFEGDSLAFKGMQVAYLLPGECIKGIGHNPITATEFSSYTIEDWKKQIDFSLNSNGVNIGAYVNSADPFNQVGVIFRNASGDNETMYYFYLKFISFDAAVQYFNQYFNVTKNKNTLESAATSLQLGTIKFDYTKLTNAGNVISYDSSSHNLTLYGRDAANTDNAFLNMNIKCSNMYTNLVTRLKIKKTRAVDLSQPTTTNFVRFEDDTINHIDGIKNASNPVELDTGDTTGSNAANPRYQISNGNISVNDNRYGVIVTAGDVTIKAGRSFHGLIIAQGSVILENGASILACDETKDWIEANPQVNQFFKDYTGGSGSGGSGGLGTSEKTITIEYENWKKE